MFDHNEIKTCLVSSEGYWEREWEYNSLPTPTPATTFSSSKAFTATKLFTETFAFGPTSKFVESHSSIASSTHEPDNSLQYPLLHGMSQYDPSFAPDSFNEVYDAMCRHGISNCSLCGGYKEDCLECEEGYT